VRTTILVADLFCGTGGTSTGLRHVCNEMGLLVVTLLVNHFGHQDVDSYFEFLDPGRVRFGSNVGQPTFFISTNFI
jgi:hypothetical protein